MQATSRSSNASPSQPKKNGWPRFSLRTLFIFTTLCAIALGNVAWRLDRKWHQQQLIAVTGEHGHLYYDYEYEQNEDGLSRIYLGDSIPKRFPWLAWLGEDFFHDIISVSYNAKTAIMPTADSEQVPEKVEQEFFQKLNQLPRLQQLDLNWGRSDLAPFLSQATCSQTLQYLTILFEEHNWHDLHTALNNFKKIRELNLCQVAPHQTKWSFLANMPELRYLRVTQDASGDQYSHPIPILEAIPIDNRIEVIDLELAQIDKAGMEHLSRFPQLRELTLHSKLSLEVLAPLAQSKTLTKLDLTDCQLTDEACFCLAQIPNLKTLILDQNPITDVGVKQFANCKKLHSLALIDTQVTGAAWENPTDFPELSRLELDRCPINSIGLQNIHRLPKLTSLRLANCPLQDKDFLVLTIPRSLTDLSLYDIPITRQTLEFYCQIESLEHLSSKNTLVSYEDIEDLHSMHMHIFFVDSSLGYNVFFCGT